MADDIDFTADEEEAPEIDFTPDSATAVAEAPRPIIPPSQDWGANAYIPQSRVAAPQFMSPYGMQVTDKGQIESRIPFDPSKGLAPLSKLALTPEEVQAGMEAVVSPFLPEKDRRALMEAPLTPSPLAKSTAGFTQGAYRTAEGLTSPMNLGLMVGTAGASQIPAAGRLLSGAFAADMARQVPEMARNLGEAVGSKDPEAIARAATELAATGAFTATAGAHAVGPRAKVILPETLRELAKEPSNVARGTSSTVTSPREVQEKSLPGVQEQPQTRAENLQELSRRVLEAVEKIKSAEARSAPENELSQLRARLSEARKTEESALRGLQQPEQPNAPPGLQPTAEGGVGVPPVSSKAPSNVEANQIKTYASDQQKAAALHGDVRSQSIEGKQALSAAESGRGVQSLQPGDTQGARGAAEARAAEVPLTESSPTLPERFQGKPIAETTDLVKGVTSEELAAYKGKAGSGATGFMWDLGAKAKTAEDVAALRKMGEEASAETKALMAKGDLTAAMKVIGRQPAEAYEYATGVKLDGQPKWEVFEKMAAMKGQTYKPSVPDPQYLKAKGETAAPAEALPADLPSLARLRVTKPELRQQIDAKIAELKLAALRDAGALKQLPKVTEATDVVLKDRPVTESEKTGEMYGESNWTHVEDVTDAQGNTLGKIRGNATPDLFQVKGANIVKSAQGKGLYQKVIRQLADKYGTVQSDTDMQPAAEAAWQKVGAQRQADGSYKLSSTKNVEPAATPALPAPNVSEREAVQSYIDKHGGKGGSVPARKPYLPSRSETFARDYNDANTPEQLHALGQRPSGLVPKMEDARDAIANGERLGYRPEDIAEYLRRNYLAAPRGIAASIRQPGALKGGEAGSVSLAPLVPVAKAAVDFVKGAPTAMKVVGAQLAGKSAPKTSTASVESGNALVRYASSKIAAPLVAESMATDVLGTHYKDAKFGEKLGAVLVEDRLRAIKDAFTKAGDTKAARKVNSLIGKKDSPFRNEAQFQAALADPEIRAAIDRHKTTVQPTAEAAHEEAGGTLAGPGLSTGAFVNLKAIFEGGEENLLRGGGRGNLMNPLRRPSRFSKTAAGTAEKYETDYRTISQRMIEGNFEESTKRQMYDQLVNDGLAKMLNPGEAAPEIGGKPAVKFVIERKGVPAGENKVRTYVKNLWVRADLAGEVRQALDVDGPVQRSAIVNAATLLNRIQLAGPTDAVWHTANMLGSIAGSQGGKNVLVDMARKIPGVNLPDAVGRVVASSIKVLAKTPEVQRQIAELADIGAMRAKGVAKEGRLARIANFNHNVIALVDKAGRLVRDDMYKNLVRRGLVEDTPANRREWVNQMGQYNGRLMGQFQRFFKDAGFSPFVVAGRNFNRMAMRRITMDPGIRAVSPKAAVEMRAIEAFGTIATLFAIPALANYLLTGSPGGRPGTKMGQIDTGKDDQGKHVVIDPAQWTGHRRGLRISGIQAIVEGAQRGETRGRIAQNVIRDVMGGVIHPWAGPAVNAASVGYTGYSPTGYKESENPKDYGKNIMAALEQLNPVAKAILKGREKGTSGVKEAGLSLGGAVGVKEVKPFTSINKMGVLHQAWMENNSDPKVKADYAQMQTATFPVSKYKALDSALATGDEAGAIQAISELKAEGQKNKDILRRMRPFVGEGITSRTKPLFHESHKLEAAFRNSLNAEQKAEYQKALAERKATYQEFLKAWRKRRTVPAATPKIDFVPDAGQ